MMAAMIGEPAPDITQLTHPDKVLDAAGAWLAGPLAPWRFRWVPDERFSAKSVLRREQGSRTG